MLEKAGYVPLAHFVLPQHCWTQNYFAAVAARIPDFLEEQGHSPGSGPNGHADAGGDRTLPRPRNGLWIRFLYRAETRKVILPS